MNNYMMVRAAALTLFAVLLSGANIHAASVDEATLDKTIETIMKNRTVPGVAIAILEQGKPIFTKGYGYANLEHGVPVTPETVFQSASVGKMFTSAAILLLEQDGKLSLNDKITNYIPSAPDSWKDITIKHLLLHRSGLPQEMDFPENMDELSEEEVIAWFEASLAKDYSDADIIETLSNKPLAFAPDTAFSYSNPGYALLGIIVKQVSGQFYGDLLKERIFEPAGMKTAQVNDIRQIIPNRSQGYQLTGDTLIRDYYVSPTLSQTADGSLLFSVLDMAAWDKALYSDTILPQKLSQKAWQTHPYSDGTTQLDAYGFGWGIINVRGYTAHAHSGGWQGFSTYFVRIPEKGLSAIVLTNREGGGASNIAKKALAVVDPDLTPYWPIDDDTPAITKRHYQLIADYVAGKKLGSGFTQEAISQLNGKMQRRISTDVSLGKEDRFKLVALDTEKGRRSYRSRGIVIHVDSNTDGAIKSLTFQGAY